jgi:hypothetical protein
MGSLYQPKPTDEPESRSRPLIIAVVLIVVIAAVIFFFARRAKPPAPVQLSEASYSSNLQFSNLHMSTARNFVGGEVTYLEGTVANIGSSALTGAQVLCIFRDSLGQVVDTPVVPMQVEAMTLGQNEFVPLNISPLKSNQKRPFRLTFEHVSADWNMGIPEIRVVSATTK